MKGKRTGYFSEVPSSLIFDNYAGSLIKVGCNNLALLVKKNNKFNFTLKCFTQIAVKEWAIETYTK